MDEAKLKPCPFCGNRYMTIFHTTSVDIVCRYCNASMRGSDETKTVKKWNTRCTVPDILGKEETNDNTGND